MARCLLLVGALAAQPVFADDLAADWADASAAAPGVAQAGAPGAAQAGAPGAAQASGPANRRPGELAEADVIRLVTTQDPDAIAARAAVVIAEAQRLAAGLYPNPGLAWDREHLPGAAGESEDALVVTVPIDLAWRRSARTHLANADVATANADAARAQSDALVRALTHFYQIIAEQQRSRIEQRAVERLTEAARIVKRRREEGNASGYDQARIEIEAELATSTHQQTQARVARLRAELALLLGVDPGQVSFSGTLDADDDIVVAPAIDGAVAPAADRANDTAANRAADIAVDMAADRTDRAAADTAANAAVNAAAVNAAAANAAQWPQTNRPSLRLLRAAEAHARDASDAAAWSWIPTVSISGGPRIAVADDTRFGYAIGVAIDVPLFSRGQALRAQAAARQRYARARARAEQRAVAIEHLRAAQRLRAARREAQRFDRAIRDRIQRLERAAESGYREGQRSIVDLLDARRARTAVETRRLALALAVKQAEVALRAARGEFE